MIRYPCHSNLIITCRETSRKHDKKVLISVYLEHDTSNGHTPYYDVSLPLDAADIVRDCLDWATPNEIVRRIQVLHPQVTAHQVHDAWRKMSEGVWKRDPEQMLSASMLLKEFKDDVDVFDVTPPEGAEMLCWGMKKILKQLRGKVVEIALDATCMSTPIIICMPNS